MRKRDVISNILRERVMLLDGAYGTELIKRANIEDAPPEVLNVRRPDIVESLHRDYIKAGSDIIITNTFGATPARLSEYGLEDEFERIVRNAVRAAKKASGGRAFVFGDAGPTGKLPFPVGDKSFDFFYENYRKLFEIMIEEDVDGIILETFSDIGELKAAVLAARDISEDVFLVAHLTFNENGRTLTGTSPMNFALTFEDLDVDAVGINCTLGPGELLLVFKELSKYTDKFLTVEPNAGMPEVKQKETIYPIGPTEFASYLDQYWKAGVNVIGGCCGTTPKHIEKMRIHLGRRKPVERKKKSFFAISSPTTVVNFEKFVIIGDRLNPSGKKGLKKAIEGCNLDYLVKVAQKQKGAGAQVLDVNFGAEQFIKSDFMEKVIYSIAHKVGTPISIDVQTPKILEKLVRSYPGKPLINSFRPVEEEMKKLEILKKYGGAVVLLTMEEKLPGSYEDRVKAFEKGLEAFSSNGIDESRIIVDPIALPIGAGGNPRNTLRFIEYLSKKSFKTTVGISNISYGLPYRSYYNSAFLVMAVDKGLSSAIMNPLDEIVMKTLKSALVVLGRSDLPGVKTQGKDKIVETILSGKSKELLEITKSFLEELKSPVDVIEKYLQPAMEEIEQMYVDGEIFLPQLTSAVQTIKPSFEYLKNRMEPESPGGRKVIVATVKGDVHDIGKNIVSAFIKASGYDVIDLGKDVPTEVIIENVKKEKPIAIALFAMMSTTLPRITEVVERLKKLDMNVPVIVGGALLNKKLAKKLGADFYAKDSLEAVKILKKIEEKVKE